MKFVFSNSYGGAGGGGSSSIVVVVVVVRMLQYLWNVISD